MGKIKRHLSVGTKDYRMNEIEQLFWDEFKEHFNDDLLEYQVVIGKYRADFLYDKEYVIEIDGHDWHGSKEQRQHDYERERFLMTNGYLVVRFTASEILKNALDCANQFQAVYRNYERIKSMGFKPNKYAEPEQVARLAINRLIKVTG